MVEKLKKFLANFKKVLSGLTPSQRVTLGVGALLVAGSLSALVFTATRRDYEFLANYAELEVEERRELETLLDAERIPWKLENSDALYVERGSRKKVVMKMTLEKKMPSSRKAFEWLFKMTALDVSTPGITSEKLRISRAEELESTINTLPWVRSSKVTITEGNDLDPLQPRRHPTKAMVNIITRNHQPLNNEDIEAVRSLVSFAVPKLDPKFVGVVIDGSPFIFKETSEAFAQSNEWMKRKIDIEEYAKRKIEEHFLGTGGKDALVRRLRVSVNALLDNEIMKESSETLREGVNPVRVTSHTNRSEAKGPEANEVGAFSETSVPENVMTTQETTAFKNEETNTTQENMPESTRTKVWTKVPGEVKTLTVALVFDLDEMVVPSQFDVANQTAPSDILTRRMEAFRDQAGKALGIDRSQLQNISVEAMPFALEEVMPRPQVADVIMSLVERSGGQFLVFGLSLFGFLYFVNVLRQAFETPELEEEMDEEEIKRRTSDEDVARMLDAQESNMADIRAKQIEDRVRKMIGENPDEAGNLIKRWLLEDEEGK